METFVIWGWLLTAVAAPMPPIIDVNYETEASCEAVKAEFKANYPSYDVGCTPTWKPDTAPKVKKKRTVRTTKKPTTYQRTARR